MLIRGNHPPLISRPNRHRKYSWGISSEHPAVIIIGVFLGSEWSHLDGCRSKRACEGNKIWPQETTESPNPNNGVKQMWLRVHTKCLVPTQGQVCWSGHFKWQDPPPRKPCAVPWKYEHKKQQNIVDENRIQYTGYKRQHHKAQYSGVLKDTRQCNTIRRNTAVNTIYNAIQRVVYWFA